MLWGLKYIYFLCCSILSPSDFILGRPDKTQLIMISFRDMVVWCPMLNVLYLLVPSNLPEAIFQKYNSPLLMAWLWSRTPGLVIMPRCISTWLTIYSTNTTGLDHTAQVAGLHFLRNTLLLLALLRAGRLHVFWNISQRCRPRCKIS